MEEDDWLVLGRGYFIKKEYNVEIFNWDRKMRLFGGYLVDINNILVIDNNIVSVCA